MAGRLEKKVVLITGTGGGQGRAAAVLFAREGAKVIGCDIKVEGNQETVRMVREASGEMVSLEPLDIADAAQAQRLVELTDKTYGRLDVLYNNASAARFGQIAEMTFQEWEFTVRNELQLIFVMTKAALPLMIRYGRGVIINTASIAGITASPAATGNFAHAMTKGGVIALTRQLAIDLAEQGIRVNAIAPGVIETPATESFVKNPEFAAMFLQKIPLKRFGQSEDVAKLALFLSSDESSYITGTTMVIDGGWSAW